MPDKSPKCTINIEAKCSKSLQMRLSIYYYAIKKEKDSFSEMGIDFE